MHDWLSRFSRLGLLGCLALSFESANSALMVPGLAAENRGPVVVTAGDGGGAVFGFATCASIHAGSMPIVSATKKTLFFIFSTSCVYGEWLYSQMSRKSTLYLPP